jgi:hypothetical protein
MKSRPSKIEEGLTLLTGILVLITAGISVFFPGFYDGIVDPRYATGIITTDIISLFCVPIMVASVVRARKDNPVARLLWVSLLVYIGYAYAVYAFDRTYTVFFPVYMTLFGMSSFLVVSILTRLDVRRMAEYAKDLRLRRTTAIFLMFTGLILYIIELPTILSRIPDGIQAGGTPFMVLDLSIVAPVAILTGIWLWQRQPWGVVLTAIFLIKAITIMTGFLIADYIDWFAGRLVTPGATIAFTIVYLLVYIFTWNYFSPFKNKKKLELQSA